MMLNFYDFFINLMFDISSLKIVHTQIDQNSNLEISHLIWSNLGMD